MKNNNLAGVIALAALASASPLAVTFDETSRPFHVTHTLTVPSGDPTQVVAPGEPTGFYDFPPAPNRPVQKRDGGDDGDEGDNMYPDDFNDPDGFPGYEGGPDGFTDHDDVGPVIISDFDKMPLETAAPVAAAADDPDYDDEDVDIHAPRCFIPEGCVHKVSGTDRTITLRAGEAFPTEVLAPELPTPTGRSSGGSRRQRRAPVHTDWPGLPPVTVTPTGEADLPTMSTLPVNPPPADDLDTPRGDDGDDDGDEDDEGDDEDDEGDDKDDEGDDKDDEIDGEDDDDSGKKKFIIKPDILGLPLPCMSWEHFPPRARQ